MERFTRREGLKMIPAITAAVLVGCDKENSQDINPYIDKNFASIFQSITLQSRVNRQIEPLTEYPPLQSAAEDYASFLAKVNYPDSELGTNAPPLNVRIEENGIALLPNSAIGEITITGIGTDAQKLAEDFLEDIANRQILYDPQFEKIGTGCTFKLDRFWCVMYFAKNIR